MTCPQCGTENPPDALRCSKCTTVLPAADMTATSGVASGWASGGGAGASTGVFRAAYAVLESGSVLGNRYEILAMLGEGGMGAVYKVRDREVDRLVALKVIRPELAAQPEILKRFKQELILARQVTHKNVIRIFDLGEADGVKFITMDFIDGQDLKSLLKEKGKLPPEQAAKIIAQVCRALDAAHSEGVVHRDLKPQNIMLDSAGRVTVMDFGIARSTEMAGMGLTQTGALVGTPEYMSPEQAKAEEVDARSDLFTLGIIFYELLTGNTPYRAETAYASLLKRTTERPRPPIELDATIPQSYNAIVMHCLEIAPADRYQSALEILADLGQSATQTGSPSRIGTTYAGSTTSVRPAEAGIFQRYGKRVGGVAVALVLITIAIVFRGKLFPGSFGGKGAAKETVSLAILPFRNGSGDASVDWLGPSLAEMLRTDVGASAALRTVSGDRIHQILADLRLPPNSDFDAGTRRRLAEFSNAQNLVYGQYVKIGEQIRIDATLEDLANQRTVPLKIEAKNEKELLGAVQKLADEVQQSLKLSSDVMRELRASALKPSTQSVLALRFYDEGIELERQGKHQDAVTQLESAVREDPGFALAFARLAQAYGSLGYDDKADESARRAVELSASLAPAERYFIEAIRSRVTGDNAKAVESYENLVKIAPENSEVQFSLASLYETTGALDRARDAFAKILQRDPKYFDALFAMGRVEIKLGDPQSALDYLNRALSLAIELNNEEGRGTVLNAIGIAYKRLNKPVEALRNYQEALTLRRKIGDKGGTAGTLNEIGQVQSLLGNPDDARKSYEEALKLRRDIGDKRGIGNTLIDLGNLGYDRGRYDDALKSYKEALQIQRDVGNEKYQALCMNNIGTIYLTRGQFSDALTYLQGALQLREKGSNPGEIAETLHNLAETSTRLGEFNKALDYYLHSLELYRKAEDKRDAATESFSLGTLYGQQGRYGAALSANEDALKALRELQDQSFWMATVLSGYGDSLSEVGRYEEARKTLDEALQLARELQNKSLIAQTLCYQGDLFFYRGDFKSARPLYEQAAQAAAGSNDPRLILVSKLNLASLAVREGRAAAAIAPLKSIAQESDAKSMRYLSAAASVELAEAFLDGRQYPAARKELDSALRSAGRLGLLAIQARSYALLARLLTATKNPAEAARNAREAARLLDQMRAESKSDALLKRSDLSAVAEALRP
jgi:eukaryotic-like serine/threonine-protein kinase